MFEIIDKVALSKRTEAKKYIQEAVALHYDALSYRSFITFFGKSFLEKLYIVLIEENNGFLVVASDENNSLEGFILASVDSNSMIKIILKKFYFFLPPIFVGVLRKPSVISKLIETLFYSKKENLDIRAELVVIATQTNIRSKGLGSKLIQYLNTEFLNRNINAYKVTVHNEMAKSNNFYIKNSMILSNQFTLYGHLWNVYTHSLNRESK